MENKICTKCNVEKPLSDFSKSKSHKGGYYPRCKACMKQYKLDNAESIKIRRKEYCNENEEKIKQYYKDNHDSRLEKRREYKKRNKARLDTQHKAYYNANKERILAYNKQWYKENKELAAQTRKRYRVNNPDKMVKIRKIYGSKSEIKEMYRLKQQKRRAIKASLPNDLTKEDWIKCKMHFDNQCAYCGKQLKNLTQDHFIALTKGGAYTKGNIIPACRHCNGSKNNRDFFEWYPKQPFYSQERQEKILKYLKE